MDWNIPFDVFNIIQFFRERLEKWQKREGKRTPIKDGTILYTTNIPVIFPYYGFGL